MLVPHDFAQIKNRTGYLDDFTHWNNLPSLPDVQSGGDRDVDPPVSESEGDVDMPDNKTHDEVKEEDSTATAALLSLLQGMAGSDRAIALQSGESADPLYGVCTMLERVLVGGCLLNAVPPEAVIRKWFKLGGRPWTLAISDTAEPPSSSPDYDPHSDYTNVILAARINVRIGYIKAQLSKRASNAGLYFNANLFPWLSMRYMIYQAGYQMVDLPDQVPFPSLEVSSSAYRGITGLPTELTVEWVRYLPADQKDKGISFRRLSASEANGKIDIFIFVNYEPHKVFQRQRLARSQSSSALHHTQILLIPTQSAYS